MARPIITAQRLRELLEYNAETGVFTRRVVTSNSMRVGDVAGFTMDSGYRKIMLDGRLYMEHRIVWLYVHGVWPPHQIDHKYGVKSDNRISELRLATNAQNGQNKRQARSDNKSGCLGVDARKGRWRACITIDGKQKHIGYFSTKELAYSAYLDAKSALHQFQTLVPQ